MKTFKEFIATESIKGLGFEKHFASYSSYIGRQRKSGDLEAQEYKPDFESLKKEYKKIKADRIASVSSDSASKIITASIEQITTDTIQEFSGGSTGKQSVITGSTEEPCEQDGVTENQGPLDNLNGEKNAIYPMPSPSMTRIHAQLFDHAVKSLQEYEVQLPKEKDTIPVKDAQVAMSCVFNTMSERACEHFCRMEENKLVKEAKSLSTIADFDDHPCVEYLRKYTDILAEKGVEYLKKKVIADRGILNSKYLEDQLPSDVALEDKVLRILEYLCEFVIRPLYSKSSPSENDCLHVWVSIFGVIAEKISMHTGEKALKASKIVRQMQCDEYGEASDAGRKVDCLFMIEDIELSNIAFKSPESCKKELALQNRKNVRLARCIQENHVTFGVDDANILMADIFGFAGIFYQVQPMGDIAVAGRTTSTIVQIPQTVGELEDFLQGNSLCIIWNFVSYLEKQGPRILRAKERYNAAQVKAKLADAISGNQSSTPPILIKKFQRNVTMSPTKKRTWTMSNMKT
ncbi:hypothetical protein BGZ49_010647 [Haplosporangium sp. Z 27]|nr:hypothetical protein BGZ49_010647 [Haplosporangium sp. Z 27]